MIYHHISSFTNTDTLSIHHPTSSYIMIYRHMKHHISTYPSSYVIIMIYHHNISSYIIIYQLLKYHIIINISIIICHYIRHHLSSQSERKATVLTSQDVQQRPGRPADQQHPGGRGPCIIRRDTGWTYFGERNVRF